MYVTQCVCCLHQLFHSLRFIHRLLKMQITFLEFFEVLLGSAEVKCSQVSEGLKGHMPSGPDAEAGCDLTETEASESIVQTTNTGSQEVRSFLKSPPLVHLTL